MKKKFFYALFIAVAMMCAACNKTEDPNDPSVKPQEEITVDAEEVVSTDGTTYFFDENGLYYSATSMKSVTVWKDIKGSKYSHLLGEIKIPTDIKVNGKKYSVTGITEEAFRECMSKEFSVVIPNTVLTIGELAFYECTHLKSVILSASITEIPKRTFYQCSELASLTIPNSVISIGEEAFYKCSNLASLTIPNSVISIGYKAFYECSNLSSITIPNSVTSIGDYAFNYCKAIHIDDLIAWCNIDFGSVSDYYQWDLYLQGTLVEDLVIPGSITNIKQYTFEYSSIKTIDFLNGVKVVDGSAFGNCKSLESVTFPESITDLSGCPYWCYKLKTVKWKGTTPPEGIHCMTPYAITDADADSGTPITWYVPNGSRNAYFSALESYKRTKLSIVEY